MTSAVLRALRVAGLIALLGASQGYGQAGADHSAHSTRLVTVDSGVELEVVDWGGAGRPIVMVAGLGGTAHDFDGFAPKLAATYHVFGITRRGFGRSSAPWHGYDADTLADDVLAVIDSLGVRRPIVAGHSMGGEELSSIGRRHPEKVAGLIYLDAGYDYALYDESHGNATIDINEVIRRLERLRFGSGASASERRSAALALADTGLPAMIHWLHALSKEPLPPGNGRMKPLARVPAAVVAGQRKYTRVDGPVLAIFASPGEAPPGAEADPAMRAMVAEVDSANAAQVRAFERGVPQARVVRIPRANHFIFRSNEADVLREMRSFIESLPKQRN